MDQQECLEAVAESDLGQGLSTEVLEGVAAIAEPLSFADGEAIVRQDDPADGMYIIVEGRAQVRSVFAGNEREVGFLSAGEFFGETALVSDQPRTATVLATGETTVLKLPNVAMKTLLSEQAELRKRLELIGQDRMEDTLDTHLGDM